MYKVIIAVFANKCNNKVVFKLKKKNNIKTLHANARVVSGPVCYFGQLPLARARRNKERRRKNNNPKANNQNAPLSADRKHLWANHKAVHSINGRRTNETTEALGFSQSAAALACCGGSSASFDPAHYRKIMAAIRIATVSETLYWSEDKRVNFDRKFKIRDANRLKHFTATD